MSNTPPASTLRSIPRIRRAPLLIVVLLSSLSTMTVPVVAAAQDTAPPRTVEAAGTPQPAGTTVPASTDPGDTADRTNRLRDEQRAYMGRNVRVHLKDGTTTKGRLIGETSEGLAVQPSPSDEPVLVPYEQVESIAVGMRRWQKIALGAGAAAAVVLALALN